MEYSFNVAAGFSATAAYAAVGIAAYQAIVPAAAADQASGGNGRQVVIGHYPEYINKAKQIGANYFDMGSAWTPEAGRAANLKFLDNAIMNGNEIILSTPLKDVVEDSSLEMEINYFFSQQAGYLLSIPH